MGCLLTQTTTGTASCSAHEVTDPSSGTRLTLLDTPGFNDQTRDDLEILGEIALFLTSQNLPPVCAIVFTHAITENRVTGSSRLNLNIAKALCGETHYSRLALLTTMWNKTPNDEARELFQRREAQILTSLTFWGGMNETGGQHARFDGSSTSGMDFLKQLLNLGQPNPGTFTFEQDYTRESRWSTPKPVPSYWLSGRRDGNSWKRKFGRRSGTRERWNRHDNNSFDTRAWRRGMVKN